MSDEKQRRKKIRIRDAADAAPEPDIEPNEGPAEEDIRLPDDEPGAEAADTVSPADEGAASSQPDPDASAETVADDIKAVKAELEDTRNRLLRVSADFQNFVRRSEQNQVTAREQTTMSITRSLLTVLDHFDHALAVDPEKTTTGSLLQGVKMVRDELMRALENAGVQRIDVTAGEPFDPNRHEAMMREQREEIETGHVVNQLQPGYALGDKTLRPAKVSVAE